MHIKQCSYKMAACRANRNRQLVVIRFFGCFSVFVLVCGGTNVEFFPSSYDSVVGKSSGFLLTEGERQSGYTTECVPLIHQFSNASASFILCAANFAKPLRFCESCGENYRAVIESVNEIEKDKKCRDTILNSDVLQIVQRTLNFVQGLWDHGNCENCFEDQNDGAAKSKLSNNTLIFWKYYNEVKNCFETYNSTTGQVMVAEVLHSGVSYDVIAGVATPSGSRPVGQQGGSVGGDHLSNSTLCKACHESYCELNTFYKELGASSKLCMDIVEMMNLTRQKWSNDFHCIIHTKDTEVVVTLSVLFCCIPVVFYLVAMIITKKHVIKRPCAATTPSGEVDSSVSPFGTNVR
ncbi:Osteopetrosis-associated transmembrane protein 1 [Holothuria leucospilota]|uniref:Osteopetrosis-associated transmembrane protein 1 n=1 Tax=Holothuria leucospilota TaxID=206669 RepID=A0A9Q1BIH7_HOLLE|nr:Osteopetrosis-associated transmembrane protein 1 [Holothuria leucospilota]